MKPIFAVLIACVALAACNSVTVKPHTIDPSKKFFADRGGFTMRRAIKEQMENRGYNVVVGKLSGTGGDSFGETDVDVTKTIVPKDADYDVYVRERREIFNPFWCFFNGFWYWRFNVSVVDRATGTELLAWRGRGCANSSVRKLNNILDQMEK